MDRDPERAPTIALTAATNSPAFHLSLVFSDYFVRLGRSRTNNRSHCIINALEAPNGRPVVTSTPAVLWHLLPLAGVGKFARRITEAVDYAWSGNRQVTIAGPELRASAVGSVWAGSRYLIAGFEFFVGLTRAG